MEHTTVRGIELVVDTEHVPLDYTLDFVKDALDITEYQQWDMSLDCIAVSYEELPWQANGRYDSPDHTVRVAPDCIDNEHTLLHEIVHHVHFLDMMGEHYGLTQEIFDVALDAHRGFARYSANSDIFREIIAKNVNSYAASNYLEIIAETASRFLIGERFPEPVMTIYEKLEGPALREP